MKQAASYPGSDTRIASSFELAARLRKRDALLTVIREAGITAENILEGSEIGGQVGTEEFWRLVAGQAGVNAPSDETKRMVLEELERVR